MKKFFIVLFCLICCVYSVSCKQSQGLLPFVSELRTDLFEGSCEHFSVKAGYGFKEQVYLNDGENKKPKYLLTFKIISDNLVQSAYNITFNHNENSYSNSFELNPVSHALTTAIEIENFKEKEFLITISNAGENYSIKMKSIVPENAISYQTALNCLEKNQPELINAFSDEQGNFNSEIRLRILVKNGKAYWFACFAREDKVKALLVDGSSGEVLAVREIF